MGIKTKHILIAVIAYLVYYSLTRKKTETPVTVAYATKADFDALKSEVSALKTSFENREFA